MVFELFKSQNESAIDAIEARIKEMFANCGEVLRLAISALDRSVPAVELGKQVRVTDRLVNRAERSIRRELVVHASVHGSGADLPLVLVYMSIIKDIERVGDYAKNIWDIAVSLDEMPTTPDLSEFDPVFERTLELVDRISETYANRDAEAATEILNRCDGWLDEYDASVAELMTSSAPSTEGVPKALLYRHLKRITAHLMNVLTAVVMPFDRLDYWDEDKVDRD